MTQGSFVVIVILSLTGILAAAGYVRTANDALGTGEAMPVLLIAFILAIGFIGVIGK